VPAPTAAQPVPSYPLTLTALDHESCPAKAIACVDLTRHLTWLQSAGRITFGPVQAEPGPPGSAHATPRGTFEVSWKAGRDFVSNIYNEPMPWAVFFAPGGIAFHGGSLTTPSHGCVHLTVGDAHYYNQHLPDGAEVVVF
jgi:lipoprotein-anchoring transpeptidase ErfK/SrfK